MLKKVVISTPHWNPGGGPLSTPRVGDEVKFRVIPYDEDGKVIGPLIRKRYICTWTVRANDGARLQVKPANKVDGCNYVRVVLTQAGNLAVSVSVKAGLTVVKADKLFIVRRK